MLHFRHAGRERRDHLDCLRPIRRLVLIPVLSSRSGAAPRRPARLPARSSQRLGSLWPPAHVLVRMGKNAQNDLVSRGFNAIRSRGVHPDRHQRPHRRCLTGLHLNLVHAVPADRDRAPLFPESDAREMDDQPAWIARYLDRRCDRGGRCDGDRTSSPAGDASSS